MTLYKIRIVYKNGYIHESWFKTLKVHHRGSEIISVEWETLNSEPSPIHMGVDEIATIWKIEEREVD